ncbi:MAG TPA: TRAP transporter permease [Alphaproteobacteria bacterium]|nr:TRAP transporter permease [Alphaproteobacteria bacterium]HIO02332.1 TRAP transporter permease [Alphaproteobacteria bacterium]
MQLKISFNHFPAAIALAMAAYHFYVVIVGVPSVFYFRGTHLLFALILVFLWYPSSNYRQNWLGLVVDGVMLILSISAIAYIFLNHDYVLDRFAYVDDLQPLDLILGTALIIVTLEATRRVIGLALPLTAVSFLAYALIIDQISYGQLIDQMYLTTEGIFGIPLNVSATYMVLFILFGALVEHSGTGKLFRDFSLALAGSSAGGPAKVACVTSAMFGTVSGSSTANVLTTGTFTIPMMKRIGYRPAFAGAVEAVASTGGQIMPPIMGAAAFVMAEFMAVSYLTVVSIAILPAILYFVAVFFAVHFEAKRTGLKGLPKPDLPRLGEVLKTRGHQFLPLAVIVGVLVSGYSPPYAALCGLLSVLPVALLGNTTRRDISWRTIFDSLITGIRNTLIVASACASAGIVIGVIAQTAIGIEFTQLIVSGFSGGNIVLALILTAAAGILLGMGLPTTPAYIVQAALLAPALVKLGIAREAAHLFVFYYAILSVITPPVAISLYAANGLSGAGLWESGIAAVKLAATGYIIPFMFVFGPPLLLIGSWSNIAWTAVTALIGVICLASSLHGYLLLPITLLLRFVLFFSAIALIAPGLESDLVGLLLVGALLLQQKLSSQT